MQRCKIKIASWLYKSNMDFFFFNKFYLYHRLLLKELDGLI